jgi:hypothetical protein
VICSTQNPVATRSAFDLVAVTEPLEYIRASKSLDRVGALGSGEVIGSSRANKLRSRIGGGDTSPKHQR